MGVCMNSLKLISTIILAVALSGCATAAGTAIITGTPRGPIDPVQVNLYIEAPDIYEAIGIVSASSDSGWTEQGSLDYAVEELKNQAAAIGANGVLLSGTGQTTSGSVGFYSGGIMYSVPVSSQTVTGQAIYVLE